MKDSATIDSPDKLTTYTFKVVVEPDEDAWHAGCPALMAYGAATSEETREEALRHIREVVEMVVAELVEDGEPIPEGAHAPCDRPHPAFQSNSAAPGNRAFISSQSSSA